MSKKNRISLFEKQPNCVSAHMEYDESFAYWVEGYKNAIEAQFESISVKIEDTFYIDSAILPLMFLIHHYLELSFKSLSWECRQTIAELNDEIPEIIEKDGSASFDIHDKGHELKILFDDLKNELKSIDEDWFNHLDIVQLEVFVDELSEIDPNGFAWRYPHPDAKNVFLEKRFHFHSLDYVTIEKIWEGIKEELEDMGLLASNRPNKVSFSSRTTNGYWTKEEMENIVFSNHNKPKD